MLYSLRNLTIGQRIFQGVSKYKVDRGKDDKLTVLVKASRFSKVCSVQKVLLYQGTSRYSNMLYCLSDLTIGLWIFK